MTPATALESTVARHGERIESLHENQQRQDSGLIRMEAKLDRLLLFVVGALLTGAGSLIAVLWKH